MAVEDRDFIEKQIKTASEGLAKLLGKDFMDQLFSKKENVSSKRIDLEEVKVDEN